MAPSPARILTERHVTTMAALDTMPHIAARIRNLLSHGRRITITRRYTHLDGPPEVTAGLTVDEVCDWRGGNGIGVHLKPGLTAGFSVSAHPGENDTEAGEWKRYHAAESVSDDWFKRRRDMTRLDITGGLPGDGPARDDLLVIRAWNRDGVCDERVVAFDYGPDRQQIREDMARHLWVSDGGDPALWDKLTDRAWGVGGMSDEVGERDKFLTAADQVLAIAWRES